MDASTSPLQENKPAARCITICCYCRKEIFKARNGEWYHVRNSSTSCKPGEGSDRRATPREIEAPRPPASEPLPISDLIAQFRDEGGIYPWLRAHIPPDILAEAEAARWGLPAREPEADQ